METVFTNKTVYTSKKFIEASRKFFRKDRKMYSAVNIALAVGFVLGGMYYAPGHYYFFVGIYMFFACFCLWSAFAGYYLKAQKMYVVQDTAYGQEHDYTIYSDRITLHLGKTQRDIKYKKITSTIETNDYFAITSDDFMFILDKNGFCDGSAEQFKTLIGG